MTPSGRLGREMIGEKVRTANKRPELRLPGRGALQSINLDQQWARRAMALVLLGHFKCPSWVIGSRNCTLLIRKQPSRTNRLIHLPSVG
jgi:hypothetical protein